MRSARRWLVVLFAVWAASASLRAAIGVTRGLDAEYFDNADERGVPALTRVDPEVSTDQMTADWVGDPPPSFSARWVGYLTIGRAGRYVLGTRSDDASALSIDGQTVVTNGGSQTRTAPVELGSGPHRVLLDYAQIDGDYEISLLWDAGEGRMTPVPVPAWRLSPNRVAAWKLGVARTLDLVSTASLIAALSWGLWVAFAAGRASGWRVIRRHPRLASFALFVVLAVAETWPLAAHPARLSRNDNGDTVLNEWTLAWFAHEAPRAPLHLYEANIFFPAHDTLAYSEAMIVQSVMAAPILWAGGSPVLAYNIVLIAGFALSGWAMFLVVTRWTGNWVAGLVSGILFAFNAHTFARLPHLQAQHVEFLPPALLALDELLRHPRARQAIWLAVWFALESLTSIYLLVFTATSLVVATLVRPEDWRRNFRKVALFAGLAGLLAGVVLLPFLLPYWHVQHDQGLTRTLDEATLYSASWQDYLTTPSRFHYPLWSYRFFASPALFPGAIGLALAALAVLRGVAWRDPRARMAVAFGVAGVVLSFGTKVPGYATLYRFVPLLHAIRGVSRFGYLGIVATAIVAGFGVVEFKRLLPATVWTPMAALLLVAVTADSWVAPIWFSRFEGVSPIYRELRDEPGTVVAELPFYGSAAAGRQARYMLNSTENWKPIINGYSGFQPRSFYVNAETLADFPDAKSIAALRADGVTHMFVHLDAMGPHVTDILDHTAGVQRLSSDGAIALYRLDRLDHR